MRLGLVLVPLVVGCFHEGESAMCLQETRLLGDDEEIAGWTGAELVAAVEGTRSAVGALESGAEVAVTIDVSHTGGAEYVDATLRTYPVRKFGFGSSTFEADVPCDDLLRVPVAMTVMTEDGAVDLTVESYATLPVEGSAEEPFVEVAGNTSFEGATLPHGDADPDDYNDPYVFVDVTFFLAEDAGTGVVGWGGTHAMDEDASPMFYVLEW